MKTWSIDDFRKEYKRVTGEEPARRWNKQTLEKKITDAEILKAGYAAKSGQQQTPHAIGEPNPAFEALVAETVTPTDTRGNEKIECDDAQPDGRGGQREGAGRPAGQTDARAHCERVMALDVPDLAVAMGVDAVNTGLARLTGVGLDETPVSALDLSAMPHGSQSMALGLTKLLYYWCPSLQGRTDAITLHLEAIFMIFNPLRERAERILKLRQMESTNGKVEQQNPDTAKQQSSEPAPAAAGPKPKAVRKKAAKAPSKNK